MKDKIFAVELSFDSTQPNICEHASKSAQDFQRLHKMLKKNDSPYFILNTCRRLTIFTSSSCPGKAFRFFEDLGIEKKHLSKFKGEDAVQHMLKIAAGLKSPNVGENEILHQLKNVLKESSRLKILDVYLRNLLQKAIETGKRIRSETTILKNNLSYPAIVHKILKEKMIAVNGKIILFIGNGKLGSNCIKYFVNKNAKVTLATRNPGNAVGFDPSVNIISRDRIVSVLANFEVVIGAASCSKPIIMKSNVEKLSDDPIFIDLAMPVNFDPDISILGPNLLFNLEYIFEQASVLEKEKSSALQDAKRIVDEEKDTFVQWLKGRKAVKIISRLKKELEQIKSEEQNRLMDDLGEMDLHHKKIVSNVVNRLTSRIAHTQYSHIKNFVVHEHS